MNMRDTIAKLRILRDMLSVAFDEWKRGVWNRDLDSLWCCDGRGCACGGTTVRDVFRHAR